jgi:acetyltransferase-like isoleucine patch superfamily enzyme
MYKLTRKGTVQRYFDDYNRRNDTSYIISDLLFPKKFPYGWKNYPFDYYNIWVKNAGSSAYMEEPTLEMLTREYDVIIFKHCFPVGRIMDDDGQPDINSQEKRLGNYKLQYEALKKKMHSFPATKFIVWTPPAIVKSQIMEEEAIRTRIFYKWLTEEWKEKGDNIYLWDFYAYETEAGLYLIELGNKVTIAAGCDLVTHDGAIRIFREADMSNADIFGKIVIGNNVFVGLNSIILPNTIIGNNCIVGAGSVVRGKFPDDSVIIGNPAKVVMKVSFQKFLYMQNQGLIRTHNLTDNQKAKIVKEHFREK